MMRQSNKMCEKLKKNRKQQRERRGYKNQRLSKSKSINNVEIKDKD